MKKLLIIFIEVCVFLLLVCIIPFKAQAGVYLRFDRNEYYETSTISYNMEDKINSTYLYDFSMNEKHGEIISGTEGYLGIYGNSFSSDTTDIEIVEDSILINNEPFTIEIWLYPYVTNRYFCSQNYTYPFLRTLANMSIQYQWTGGATNVLISNTTISLNEWSFFALTYDSVTYDMIMYLNNSISTIQPVAYKNFGTVLFNDWNIIMFGSHFWDSWSGRIDEVRIYDHVVLTKTQIETDMLTSIAVKLEIEDLEPNEDITQLYYENETLFEQQTANANGDVEYNVFDFSNKNYTYQGFVNVYHEDTQYYGYLSVLNWGDIYSFVTLSEYEDLFIQLFYGEGAWLGLTVLVVLSFFCLKLYKYSAVIWSIIFVLLGLQYYQAFTGGSDSIMWFFVFCWIMPVFLMFAMFKLKR